jgi:hypothetical protein
MAVIVTCFYDDEYISVKIIEKGFDDDYVSISVIIIVIG